MNPDNGNKQKQNQWLWALGILAFVLLINSIITPMLAGRRYEEVDYSTFLNMLEDGDVEEVAKENNEILFKGKKDGKTVYMQTGAWDSDFDLVDRLHQQGVEFTQIAPKQASPIFSILLSILLPFLLLLLLGQFLTKQMSKRMGGGAMSFGDNNAKIYADTDNKVTFKDVAGQDEAKESLMEIVDFLHNPKKYESIGALLPKGVLLVGPPGTGKTLIARAVAGEAGVPFFSISGSEFVQMFVGMGAAKVRDLFKQANEKAPCIIFIDEIDTIGKKRDNGLGGSNDEREQTLNQLLSEMDGFDSSKGVILLGATNRPESLDAALLRPGRFDRRVPVELPDLNGRIAILEVHSKDVNMGPDINFKQIALATAGASGADLANMINEAALRAVRNNRYAVTQEDLEESVEVVIAGYQRKNAVISEKEKRIVSYHEIGHALVTARQSHTEPVHKITIIPRTSGALGYTMQVAEEESNLMSKDEVLARIVTMTGGRAAEEVIFGIATSGASNDIEQATKLARAMVTRLGMTDEFGMVALETVNNQYLGGDASLACSPETSAMIDKKVIEIIKDAHAKAVKIIEENKEEMHVLAKFLLEKETITGKEFMAILADCDKEKVTLKKENTPEEPIQATNE